MIRMIQRVARGVALSFIFAQPLLAQEPVESLPSEYSVSTVDEWFLAADGDDARWRERVVERFATELANGLYLKVLEQLAEEFRQSTWLSHNDQKTKFQTEFDALVDRYREALIQAGLEDEVKTEEERSRVLEAMGNRGAESLRPQAAKITVEITDLGREEFDVQFFFLGSETEIKTHTINSEGLKVPLVPVELVRDMRLRGHAVWAVLKHFVEPIQDAQFNAIRDANFRWDNYLKNGYSQYPWEALINGWLLNFSAFDPPDKQWIFVHASLALSFSTASYNTTEYDQAINIEALGFLWYFGKNGKHYMGFSVAAAFRDDIGPGIGPVLHLGRNMSIGVAWHDSDGNDKLDDPAFVLLSFDLFRFLGTESSKFKAEVDKLKLLAGNVGFPE